MRKLFFTTLALLLLTKGMGQVTWSGTTPGNIHYTLGNVGIGTANPQALLDVSGQLRLGKTGLGGRIDFARPEDGSIQGSLGWSSDGIFRQYFAGGGSSYRIASYLNNQVKDLVTVLNNGNVGIGTSTPRGVFDAGSPGDIYLVNDPNSGDGAQSIFLPGHIYIAPHGNSNISYLQARRQDNSGSTSLRIRTWNAGNLIDAMHVASDGKVGIGTTAPQALLHINSSQVYPRYLIQSTNPNGKPGYTINEINGNEGWTWHYDMPGGFTGFFKGGFGNTMVISNSGNVGIGTEIPTSKLTVAGDIHSRKVKVTISAGADFVFEDDYDLKKLDDLQKFIQQHKHLPEIPSAKEMVSNGVELGEMNIKLLQKIEELTLYILEQNRKIEKLELRLSNIEKKN